MTGAIDTVEIGQDDLRDVFEELGLGEARADQVFEHLVKAKGGHEQGPQEHPTAKADTTHDPAEAKGKDPTKRP